MLKIKSLETENLEKELRVQELLDEKQRIHNQWADERRSLDHRVRLLEQNLRILQMSSNNTISSIANVNSSTALNNNWNTNSYSHSSNNVGYYKSNHFYGVSNAGSRNNSIGENIIDLPTGSLMSISAVNELGNSEFNHGMVRQCSSIELPIQSFINDSTYARMEELRRKIVDRRSSVSSESNKSSVVVPNFSFDISKVSFDR